LEEEWLSRRFELFQTVCVPSVRAQTDTNFRWIVGIDARVPQWHQRRVEEAIRGIGHIVRVQPGDSFSNCALKGLGVGKDIISARLDSDDALASTFVKKSRRCIRRDEALSLIHGVQLNASPRSLRHSFSTSNSFSLLWSRNGTNVLELGRHKEIGNNVRIRNRLTLTPLYMVLAHDINTSTYAVRGLPVCLVRRALARFQIEHALRPSARDQRLLAWRTLGGMFDKSLPTLSRWLHRVRSAR